ncbi:hypothetical protein Tco_1207623, partial [Tanacetum coccineum]
SEDSNCKGGDEVGSGNGLKVDGNTDAGGNAGSGGDGICGNGDDSGVSGDGGGVAPSPPPHHPYMQGNQLDPPRDPHRPPPAPPPDQTKEHILVNLQWVR